MNRGARGRTPSTTVPGVMRECAEMGVKGVIIISAGFKEIGPEGGAMQAVSRKLGFEILQPGGVGESVVKAVKVLDCPAPGGDSSWGLWNCGEKSG